MMIIKTGSARWHGGLKDGSGHVSTKSGALKDQPYGFNTRFEDKPGTNPEELLGAAHASCFSMALSNLLTQAGITGVEIETSSDIGLDRDADGFTIKTAHLTTRIKADAPPAQILEIARTAEKTCPVSRVLNAEVTMDATVL